MTKQELHSNCRELIAIKKLIDHLLSREKHLKKIIEPHVTKDSPIKIGGAKIYIYECEGNKSFCRQKVLDYVERKYTPKLVAEIDRACTKIGPRIRRVQVKF